MCRSFPSVPMMWRSSMGFLYSRYTFPAALATWESWLQDFVFWCLRWFSQFLSVHTSLYVYTALLSQPVQNIAICVQSTCLFLPVALELLGLTVQSSSILLHTASFQNDEICICATDFLSCGQFWSYTRLLDAELHAFFFLFKLLAASVGFVTPPLLVCVCVCVCIYIYI